MEIPQTVYIVEAMRPDRDDWFPSRVFTKCEDAIRASMVHEGLGKRPWVFRVVEFKRVREVEFSVIKEPSKGK